MQHQIALLHPLHTLFVDGCRVIHIAFYALHINMPGLHALIYAYKQEIRTDYRESYFKERRQQLILSLEHDAPCRSEASFINVLGDYPAGNPVDFPALNAFVVKYQQSLSLAFQEAFLAIFNRPMGTLERTVKDEHALAALANLLNREDFSLPITDRLDLRSFLPIMINANLYIQNGQKKLRYPTVLAILLSSLCSLVQQENPQDLSLFQTLLCLYPLFEGALGLKDTAFLILLSQFSEVRSLLPNADIVERLMRAEIGETVDSSSRKILMIVERYFRSAAEVHEDMYVLCLEWMGDRLRQTTFPNDLKAKLMKLFTMIVNSLPQDCAILDDLPLLPLTSEIMMRGRYGSHGIKIEAIKGFLCAVERCGRDTLRYLFDHMHLAEFLVSSLEIMDQEILVRLLTIFPIVINLGEQYLGMLRENHFESRIKRVILHRNDKVTQSAELAFDELFPDKV